MLGLELFAMASTTMLLGADSVALKEGRAFGVQALSGTGIIQLKWIYIWIDTLNIYGLLKEMFRNRFFCCHFKMCCEQSARPTESLIFCATVSTVQNFDCVGVCTMSLY